MRKTYIAPRRSKAGLVVLIVLAVLLMVAAIILATSLPAEIDLPDETNPLFVQPLFESGFDADYVQMQNTWPFGTGVVSINNNRLSFLNIQGQEVFSEDIEIAAPFCLIAGEYLVAADRDGHNYLVLNEEKVLFKGNLSGRIAGAAIRKDGWLALIEEQTDGHGIVRIFEPDSGLKLFDCYFPESGYVLSVSFCRFEDAFDVALLNTNGSAIQPVFKRYRLDGQELGQLMPEYRQIMPIFAYDQKAQMAVAGQSRVDGLDYDKEEPVYSYHFNQVKTMINYDQGYLILARLEAADKWSLFIYPDGKELSAPHQIGDEITLPAVRDEFMVIGSGTLVKLFDLKKQEILIDLNLGVEVIRVGFASSDALTVVTSTGVRRISLT